MKREPIVCALCGERFEPVGTQKLCSPACVRAAKTTHQRTRRAFIEHGSDPGRVETAVRRAARDREQSRELRRDEIAASLAARERELVDSWRERQK